MRIRTALAAAGCVLALALAGCGTSIAGSPQAALPVSASAGNGDKTPEVAPTGELALPNDGEDSSSGDDSSIPDLGELLGSLGGDEGLSGVEGLGGLEGLGDDFDAGQLGQLLGSGGLGDIGGLMSPECGAAASASISLGMLMLAPALGQSLTQADIDKTFASLSDLPAELAGPVAKLRAAAEASVGASASDAIALMGDPAVSDALDHISTYMEQHCSGQ